MNGNDVQMRFKIMRVSPNEKRNSLGTVYNGHVCKPLVLFLMQHMVGVDDLIDSNHGGAVYLYPARYNNVAPREYKGSEALFQQFHMDLSPISEKPAANCFSSFNSPSQTPIVPPRTHIHSDQHPSTSLTALRSTSQPHPQEAANDTK